MNETRKHWIEEARLLEVQLAQHAAETLEYVPLDECTGEQLREVVALIDSFQPKWEEFLAGGDTESLLAKKFEAREYVRKKLALLPDS